MTMVVQKDLREIKDGYPFSKVFITKIYQKHSKKKKQNKNGNDNNSNNNNENQ